VKKMKSLYENVIIAGFGGQGVLFIGRLLAYAAMKEGRNVTWIPSYGPEMRGGTANCTVVISDEVIGSPVITSPYALIVMNNPSLDVFEPRLKTSGLLIINSSLITRESKRNDVTVVKAPANKIAFEIGSDRAANMVLLGVYIARTKVVTKGNILAALQKVLGEKKKQLFEINKAVFEKGIEIGNL
jgi:2-oxoglutarate ferredoxin oxidoreductase subunit gamma